MKKLSILGICLVLLGTLLFSLLGTGEEGFGGVTIRVIGVKDPYWDLQNQLIPDFEKETGITVVNEGVSYESAHEKIMLDFASGRGYYDVILIDAMWSAQFIESRFLEKLTDFIERDSQEVDPSDIPENTWGSLTHKGETYGIPFCPFTKMVWYRKDLFDNPKHKKAFKDRYAYELVPPVTWEQFRDVAEYFTQDWDGDGNMNYGVAISGARGAAVAQHFNSYFRSFGGKWFKRYPKEPWDLHPTFDSLAGVEALAFYVDLLKYAPPDVLGYAWYDTGEALWSGKVAMIFHWADYGGLCSDPSISKIVGKVGAALPPTKKGLPLTSPGGSWGYTISSGSKQKEAAWEYIKWACSYDTQLRMAQTGIWDQVNRISLLNNPTLREKYPWSEIHAGVLKIANPYCRPVIPPYTELEEIQGLRVNQAMMGELGVEEALKKIDEDMTEVLKRRGYIE